MRKLLLTLFDGNQARMFLSDYADYSEVADVVNWQSGQQDRANQIAMQLERSGYLNGELFDRLVEARPGQQAAIRSTQETVGVEQLPITGTGGGASTSITVLFWAANPVDTDSLRLDEEIRTIDERIRASEHRDCFELESQGAVRYSDLAEGLLRYRPQIVHFSGHGDSDGRLVFEDNQGIGHEIDVDALAELFRVAGKDVRCVVFNACYSAEQADAVAAHVDCVVGTTRAIEDPSALAFAAGFYRAFGYGESVQTAFDLGRTEVDLAALADSEVLRLHTKEGIDAADVFFCDTSS